MANRPEDPLGKEELLELILESAVDFAIFTVDVEGAVTSWNVAAESLFGFSGEEMLGKSADILFTAEDRAKGGPEQERAQAAAHGRALDERKHRRKDGSVFWASGLLMRLKRPAQGYVKITRDRSEQHAAEERLQEREERFRLLATSIPQLVFRTRSDGYRTWPSPQWVEFTGLSFDHSLGFGWLDAVHPEDRSLTEAEWRAAIEKGEYYVEHRLRRRGLIPTIAGIRLVPSPSIGPHRHPANGSVR